MKQDNELLTCPFCGSDARAKHHDRCYFAVLEALKKSRQVDLSWAPGLLAAWNRRAPDARDARDARIAELEAELAALKAPTANPGSLPEMKQINDLPATPWYPDDSGEWVEVPEDLMEMPANVGRNSLLEVLFQHERDDKDRLECKDIARWCKWDMPAGKGGRIVAYKVVKP